MDRLNSEHATTESRRKGQAKGAINRRTPITEIIAIQQVLYTFITESIKVLNGDKVAYVPAREVASCAVAWDKLEERRREALGKPRLAPLKVEPKKARSRSPAAPVDT